MRTESHSRSTRTETTMTFVRPRSAAATTLVLVVLLTAIASAEQKYRVAGTDSFQIGARDLRSEIVYDGIQTLTIVARGKAKHYVAKVDYLRTDQGAKARVHGSYESTVGASGDQTDGPNRDPDYLTVLNQPFAVQLDASTIRDLSRLHAPVPFDFPSPMTGAPLHGSLKHMTDGTLGGVRVLGVAFSATGPIHGPLPDHPGMMLAGSITMNGTAYYTYDSALLLALDATLSIAGNLASSDRHDQVTIVYKRTIRADQPTALHEARAATASPALVTEH
jgi:hypothetical protein